MRREPKIWIFKASLSVLLVCFLAACTAEEAAVVEPAQEAEEKQAIAEPAAIAPAEEPIPEDIIPPPKEPETLFEHIAALLPGTYNNSLFIRDLDPESVTGGQTFEVSRHRITPLKAPALGEAVFFGRELSAAKPRMGEFPRIFNLVEVDGDPDQVRMEIHLPDAAILAALSGAVALTPEGTTHAEGCDIIWTEGENGFEGKREGDGCILEGASGHYRLTKGGLFINREPVAGTGNAIFEVFRKGGGGADAS